MHLNILSHLKLFLICCLLAPLLCHAQSLSESEDYHQWFDSQTGEENSQVFKGTVYVEKYRVINKKHKFFTSPKFLPGFITYEEQPYFNLELKYDLYEDELLLRSKNGKKTTLILNRDKVTIFNIDSREFINVRQGDTKESEVSGFYEVLMETSFFKLLKKHRKNILKKVNRELVSYEFKSDNQNFIFYKNTYHPLNKKKDVLRLFPKFKKSINSYYKTSRGTSDTDIFLKFVLRNIEQELLKQQNESTK